MRIVAGVAFIAVLFSSTASQARDYGRLGEVFPIEEVNLLQAIASRLKGMQSSGELARKQDEFRKKVAASIDRPTRVQGLSPATSPRVFRYDPSMVFQETIKDDKGRVIVPAGTRVSPAQFIPFTQTFIFFDGDRKEEMDFVMSRYARREDVKLIMTNGAPLKAMKFYQQRFYFDQGGTLTTRLGIRRTPTVVEPDGQFLKLTEVVL